MALNCSPLQASRLFLHVQATRHDVYLPYAAEIAAVRKIYCGSMSRFPSIFRMKTTARERTDS